MKTEDNKDLNENNYVMFIRSYTRTELAMMYMPYLSKSCALKNFNNWLKINKNLWDKLVESGVTERTRRYTPRQVKLIFDAFDMP